MDFPYPTPFGDYTLSLETDDRSLRPWNAADEYLLSTVKKEDGPFLIINDRAGALTVPFAGLCSALINDSLLEADNCRMNLQKNNCPAPDISSCLHIPETDCKTVLIKIPKSVEYFRFQLQQLKKQLPGGTRILAAEMNKALPLSFFECFEEEMSRCSYSRILKKARYYEGQIPQEEQTHREEIYKTFVYGNKEYRSLPGVFSHGRLDGGSRMLLDYLCLHAERLCPDPPLVVDPGCGAGILGLTALDLWPEAELWAADVNALAVESCLRNAVEQGKQERITLRQSHILSAFPEQGKAGLVLCNPPFHSGRNVSMETGFAFIRESAALLSPEGRFLMVANRSLGYSNVLQNNFTEVRTVKEKGKYRLSLCTR